MCVAGKNTGAMRDWAMSTKVDTSRSRWRATSISGLWPDTLSATRCAPISSCERRNGGGQACGAESGTGTILTRWGVLDYGLAMPRTARVAPGGMVFHVLNRGVARMQLFEKAADYQAFEQVLRDSLDQSPMRICAYAVMPNHWHLLLWPECD